MLMAVVMIGGLSKKTTTMETCRGKELPYDSSQGKRGFTSRHDSLSLIRVVCGHLVCPRWRVRSIETGSQCQQ